MDGSTPAEEGADEKHFNELAMSHRASKKVSKPAALEETKKVEDVDD